MGVVKVGGLAVETLAAVLFLEGALGQADMGLIGGFAFFERIHVALHLQYTARIAQRGHIGTTCKWVLFGAMIWTESDV